MSEATRQTLDEMPGVNARLIGRQVTLLYHLLNLSEERKNLRFSMANFARIKRGDMFINVTEHTSECDTCACVLGYSYIAKLGDWKLVTKDNSMFNKRVDWWTYSDQFVDSNAQQELWHWLYGSEWADYDDTLLGALKRIASTLTHGFDPKWKPSELYALIYQDFDLDAFVKPI